MQSVSVETLKSLLDQPNPEEKTIVVDVRSPEEFAAGHIPGAVNRPLEELTRHEEALRAYDRVYVNCFSGGRSGEACARLDQIGLTNAVNVEGGMMLWKRAGFPVET